MIRFRPHLQHPSFLQHCRTTITMLDQNAKIKDLPRLTKDIGADERYPDKILKSSAQCGLCTNDIHLCMRPGPLRCMARLTLLWHLIWILKTRGHHRFVNMQPHPPLQDLLAGTIPPRLVYLQNSQAYESPSKHGASGWVSVYAIQKGRARTLPLRKMRTLWITNTISHTSNGSMMNMVT